MSNDSSVSETTPLRRRPENPASEQIVGQTSQLNNTNSSVSPNSSRSNTVAFAKTSNNNNNVEVRLVGDFAQSQLQPNGVVAASASTSPDDSSSANMDSSTKRIAYRVAFDVVILLFVGVPILAFHLWGKSYRRGFFCDDESLKHPYHDSTIKTWMLYIIGLVIPVAVIFGVETFRAKLRARNGASSTSSYNFMGHDIPEWLFECYKKIGIFGFGAAVSQLTTDIAKYSIGRLRPHFFDVCRPIINDGTTCADAINIGRYIEDYRCYNPGATQKMIKEVALSFPSGHSSFTFYTMVYVALYLQSRMTWRGSQLLRPFLQFLFIMIAWYTALSRVSDYKHHWSDVLAGSAIGALVAIIVNYFVPRKWFNWKSVWTQTSQHND